MSIGIGCFEASSSFLLKLSAAPMAASRCSGAHLEDSPPEMSGANHFTLHDFHTSGAVLSYPAQLRCEDADRGNMMPEKPEAQAFCSARGLHLKHSDQEIIGSGGVQATDGTGRRSDYAAQDLVLPVRSRAFVAYDRHSDQEVIDNSGPVRFQSIGSTDRHVNQVVLENNVEADRLPEYIIHDRHSDQVLIENDECMSRESLHPLVPKTIDFIGQHSGHLMNEGTELLRLHSCSSSDRHLDCSSEGNTLEVQGEESEAGSQEEINRLSGVTAEGLTSDSETGVASNVGENGMGPYFRQLHSNKHADCGSPVLETVEAEMDRLRKEHEQLQQQQEVLQQKMACIEIDLARLQSIYMPELEKQRNNGSMLHQVAAAETHHVQELVHNMPGSGSDMQHCAMEIPDPFSQPIPQHLHEPASYGSAQPASVPEALPYAPAPSTHSGQVPHRLFDGYNWRKYGEMLQPGKLHPRVFYGCSNMGCIARKIEEKSDDGLMKRMYEGVHNHPVPRKSAKLLDSFKRRRRYRK